MLAIELVDWSSHTKVSVHPVRGRYKLVPIYHLQEALMVFVPPSWAQEVY